MAKKKREDGEGGEAEAPKSKKKMIIIAAAVVVVLAGGGGGFFFMKKTAHADTDAAHGEHAAVEVKKPVVFLDVRDMILNLGADPGKPKTSLLRLRVMLELKDAKVEQEVKPLLPRVEDAFQVYMRELRTSDLAGSAGLYRLREELLRRVNISVYPAKVEAVLFKEVVIQEQ